MYKQANLINKQTNTILLNKEKRVTKKRQKKNKKKQTFQSLFNYIYLMIKLNKENKNKIKLIIS